MATDIVQGLFGLTPEAYQAEQNRQAQAEAMRFAQLDPFQQANYGLYMGGRQLGGVVGQALGAQDPTLQRISQQQALLRDVNQADPESLLRAAQQASAFSPQLATSLADRAKAIQTAQANQAKDIAAAQSSLASAAKSAFEMGDVGRAQDLVKTGKYTPESVAKYVAGTGQLELIDKASKPTSEFLQEARGLGLKAEDSYNAYTPEQTAKVNQAIFDRKIKEKAAGAAVTRIDLGSALEKIYLSKDREEAAKNWAAAGKAYEVTVPLLNQLDQVEKIVPNAFTGAFAEPKLALSKALGGFGVNIGTKATDTEYINAISSKVVQQIARVFPGSLAVKELDQLVKSKFNVAQEAPTILRLLGQIRDEMKAQTATYEQGSKLSDTDRSAFNSSLATGQNIMKINRYRELENKYRNGTISDTERTEAKNIKQALNL